MQVREIMSTEVDLLDPTTPVAKAAQIMSEDDVGALPIGENDRLVGMLTDRDIVVRGIAAGKDVKSATAREVMSPGILYCFEDQSVEDAAQVMSVKQVRRLAVLNRDKRLVGMVSLGDISGVTGAHMPAEALEAVSHPAH
jgi:CBS domain-containing protein